MKISTQYNKKVLKAEILSCIRSPAMNKKAGPPFIWRARFNLKLNSGLS